MSSAAKENSPSSGWDWNVSEPESTASGSPTSSAQPDPPVPSVIPSSNPGKRLVSLDAYRGANMLFIMGGATLVVALSAFWPDSPFWKWTASQMNHVQWNGVAHHDMIFPTFLFIAGCAFPFSFAKQRERGRSNGRIALKVVLRGLILVLLGVFYNNNVSFSFAKLRYASVLGHIGLAWMLAALMYMFLGIRIRVAIFAGILIGYWLLLANVRAPDAPKDADSFSMAGSIVGYIDRNFLPGRCYMGIHDPEGILSTVPAIATAMLGCFSGEWLRLGGTGERGNRKALGLMAAGVVFVLAGLLWNRYFPICKQLWSSSFVCFVGGFSMFGLGVFYWLIDVKGWNGWAFFFVVIGMNSIAIYLAQKLVSFQNISNMFFGDAISRTPEIWHAPLNSCGYVAVCWLFLFFLYRRKIFLKV